MKDELKTIDVLPGEAAFLVVATVLISLALGGFKVWNERQMTHEYARWADATERSATALEVLAEESRQRLVVNKAKADYDLRIKRLRQAAAQEDLDYTRRKWAAWDKVHAFQAASTIQSSNTVRGPRLTIDECDSDTCGRTP